ncbi:actin interacting protein 1 [Scheffersomyces amazonensis]|uniref:actin interacting protein 1 n=1 Tax=Scheffersomyces amazonensis TaxID=1078765 RepID=UPI00315D01F0
MSIQSIGLIPPQPSTVRANTVHLSYDKVHDRIVYPNGKSIIVRSVDPKSNEPILQFIKHVHPTTCATFSPSGNYVASGDESGNVKIWEAINYEDKEIEKLKVKSEFQILSGPIKSIAWDNDNSRIIAVGQGKEKFGHCFTWDSGNSIGEIQGHSSTIYDVDIKSQRPYRAATVSEDKALVFFNGPPFKFDKSIRGYHTNAIRSVKFSPDGKWLISVGSDRIITIYDGKTGEYINKIEKAHEGGIFAVSWFEDSLKFVTASADNTLKIWNIETLKSENQLGFESETNIDNQQVGVVVTKDYIISLTFNGYINYFTTESTRPVLIALGHQTALTSLLYVDNTILTGGSDGSIFKWKQLSNSFDIIPSKFGNGHSNYVADFIQLDQKIYSIGWDDKLKQWENNSESKSVSLSQQPKALRVIGKKLLILFENRIELFNLSLEKEIELDLEFSAVDIGIIGEDKVLVTNLSNNSLKEYTLIDNKFIESTTNYSSLRSPPAIIRISPDGKYGAIADNTGKYTLYDVINSTVVTTRWAFHSSKVIDAKWTSDSKFIISGGLDTGLLLYSVNKPSKVLKFPLAHQIGISGLEWLNYDPEAKTGSFASIGLDGSIKVWNVDFSVY